MKLLSLFLVLLAQLSFAEDPAPTYKASPKREQYSFGLRKPEVPSRAAIDSSFLDAPGDLPGALHLKQFAELAPVKNQGNCGSCVYFATSAAFEDTLRIRGMVIEKTAPQFLMDCAAREWMCNGSYFEKVAAGLVNKGGAAREADYPYRASNQSCKGSPALIGQIKSMRLIDPSPKSVIAALNQSYAVAVTVEKPRFDASRLGPASVPTTPGRPLRYLFLLVGALVGALGGLLLTWFRSIREEDEAVGALQVSEGGRNTERSASGPPIGAQVVDVTGSAAAGADDDADTDDQRRATERSTPVVDVQPRP